MGLDVKAYSGKGSKDFQKHYNAVKFCIENELSYPKETSEFFKGKINGDDLEDIKPSAILKEIENGIEVPLKMKTGGEYGQIIIKVSDIPSSVDEIIVSVDF